MVETKHYQHLWFTFSSLFFVTFGKEKQYVSSAGVYPQLNTMYVTRTYHLLKCVYVEGPAFVYTVNVILYFSMYLKCIEYVIPMKAFQ